MRKWINVDHPDNNVVKSHVPLNKISHTIRGRLVIQVLFILSFLSSASLVCEVGGMLGDLSPCGKEKCRTRDIMFLIMELVSYFVLLRYCCSRFVLW